jgi:hypothetical protein
MFSAILALAIIALASQYAIMIVFLMLEGGDINGSCSIFRNFTKKEILKLWTPFGWVPFIYEMVVKHIASLKEDD